MKDKRAFPRLKMDCDIEYQIYKQEQLKPALDTQGLLDLGGGGFSFKTGSLLGANALIQFAIRLKEDRNPIIGVAKTVWSQAFENSFKNGMNFVWVSWKGKAAQNMIAEYVEVHLGDKPH